MQEIAAFINYVLSFYPEIVWYELYEGHGMVVVVCQIPPEKADTKLMLSIKNDLEKPLQNKFPYSFLFRYFTPGSIQKTQVTTKIF